MHAACPRFSESVCGDAECQRLQQVPDDAWIQALSGTSDACTRTSSTHWQCQRRPCGAPAVFGVCAVRMHCACPACAQLASSSCAAAVCVGHGAAMAGNGHGTASGPWPPFQGDRTSSACGLVRLRVLRVPLWPVPLLGAQPRPWAFFSRSQRALAMCGPGLVPAHAAMPQR